MTDQKKPETMEDADLDQAQGGFKASSGLKWVDASSPDLVKKDEDKKLLGDDLGVI
ncbi:MAG: hypothetical protein ACFB03_12585 [Paracoccaceae bacterium]